jgi:hypothetical protein
MQRRQVAVVIRADEVSDPDLESIERAATDYIEAWLTGDADRMADCLHAGLTKRSLDFDAATGNWAVDSIAHRDMVEATANGRGTKLPREYTVTILDVFRNVATAKVDSARYVDYLHIGRFEDRWRIVNVLWEPLTRD